MQRNMWGLHEGFKMVFKEAEAHPEMPLGKDSKNNEGISPDDAENKES